MPVIRDQLWLDRPDAKERIAAADVEDAFKQVALDLIDNGASVLRGWHDPSTCKRVIDDYKAWCDLNPQIMASSLDALGHEKRLCNFHQWSPAALAIGQAPRTMRLLDFLFGYEAGIYTSLIFKYGSQQPSHRDTPHFATWPPSYYIGVWTALEDVHPDSGPLFFHRRAHRFDADPETFWKITNERIPNASDAEKCLHALDLYNGHIITQSHAASEPIMPEMKAGDTVVWHPQTPHGGSAARNPELTRWSIVFHCAPVDIQVHQHDRFFTHAGDGAPPERYGFIEKAGRKVAAAGDVGFM